MSGTYSQKTRILYVMKILLKYSDEQHPLSREEISRHLQEYGIEAERKSIYDDIKILKEFGIDIENKRTRPAGFYIANREFELPELKLLVDAVQSSKFITRKKSNELIRKIETLTSVHEAKYLQRQVFASNRIKTMNESIYYNVDKIHMAISQNYRIEFYYYEWTPTKTMQPRKNGMLYEISPWGLSWDNENYYMLGYDKKAGMIKHYRVDKMMDITLTDSDREGKTAFAKFDMACYAKKVFGMFGGEEQKVTILCENILAGAMIDRFGKEVIMHPVDEAHFTVSADVSVSQQFYGWIMALGAGAVIVSPQTVVEGFKQHVENVMKKYEENKK